MKLRQQHKLAILVITAALLLGLKLVFISRQTDVGWEPDSYMHFLELRTVFADFPTNLDIGLGVWSKPLYTYPLGLLVQLFNITTLSGVQAINAVIWAVVGLLVFATCRRMGIRFGWAWLAFVLTQVNFLSFRASVSELTEPIFTLVLMAAIYAAASKQWLWAVALTGIGVLGRLEGAFFVAYLAVLAAANLPRHRWWQIILLGGAPLAVWNLLGYLNTGKLLFIVQQGYPTTAGAYGFGSPIHYILGLITQEPLLMLLAGGGCALLVAKYRQLKWRSEAEVLIAGCIVGFGLLQSVLWTFGLFGTAGLLRYFVCIMPLLVVLVAYFLQHMFRREVLHFVLLFMFVVVGLQAGFTLQELRSQRFFSGLASYPTVETELSQTGEWLRLNAGTQHVYSVRPEVIYYARRDLRTATANLNHIKQNKPGVYVWTSDWGPAVGITQRHFNNTELIYNLGKTYVYRVP